MADVNKDEIMEELLNRIASHPDNPQVTEDFSKAGSLMAGGPTFVPSVIVVERPDLVLSDGLMAGDPVETRQAFVSVISFVQARSGELGPTDMRAFTKDLRKVIYKDKERKIGTGGTIKEKQAGTCMASPESRDIFVRELIFRIEYKENLGLLFGP